MRRAISFWLMAIIGSAVWVPGEVLADLFEARASDTAVKMIRFPQSMAVIQYRPDVPNEKIDRILNDPRTLKRTLRKIDPSRIAPAILAEDFTGPVTRGALDALGKKYDVDLLLVFRREILSGTPESLKLRNRALVYLVRQKKLLVVPPNETSVSYQENEIDEKVGEMNERGLKQLAKDARKVILSHKFEKRRSNY